MLEPLDCVVIGDPDHCIDKIRGYRSIGVDRMMCMMQFGDLAPDAVIRSIELAGRRCIPAFADVERVAS